MLSCNCSTRSDLDTSLETKLLFEKDDDDFSHILNMGLDQGVEYSGPDYSLQYSGAYSFQENFAAGFEVQSDMGKANGALHWRDEQNYIGPAIYAICSMRSITK